MTRQLAWILTLLGLFAAIPSSAVQRIYFNNRRIVEASHHEVKGPLIYVTLTNGAVVIMKADEVDWEATARLAEGDVLLRKDAYEDQDDQALHALPTTLTVADLKNFTGASRGLRRRRPLALSVSVYGSQGWTDSGVDVRPTTPVLLVASGRVDLSPGVATGPDGRLAGKGGIEPDLPYGALIGRIGNGSAFHVGSRLELNPEATGRLFLCVNDNEPSDNSGAFEVKVTPRVMGSSLGSSGTSRSQAGTEEGATSSAASGRWRGEFQGVGRAHATREAVEGRKP